MEKLEINHLEKEYRDRIENVGELKELERIQFDLFGKNGELAKIMNRLKLLGGEEKAEVGKDVNRIKKLLKTQLKERKIEIQKINYNKTMEDEWVDITIDPIRTKIGSLHPITMVQNSLEDIFISMGFRVQDGPHLENESFRSETPAIWSINRTENMQRAFDFGDGHQLRNHIFKTMVGFIEKLNPPFKIISAGKVFSDGREDEKFDICHHKIGGMIIDKDLSVAHLHYFMNAVLSCVFQRNVKIRMRPSYSPFFEPGFALDMQCLRCEGTGCKKCRMGLWDMLLYCGMVHPKILNACGINPAGNCGLAFDIDVERIVRKKFGIRDMWALHS